MGLNGFHLGIVVQNNDPEKRGRVKIFVPEHCPPIQPLTDTMKQGVVLAFKSIDSVYSPEIASVIQDIKNALPWAEQAGPIFGGNASGRYNARLNRTSTSDSNAWKDGERVEGYRPANEWLGEDGVSDDFDRYNVYSHEYKPSNYSGMARGTFSIPNVGAHVYLFYLNEDIMHPVYFASSYGNSDFKRVYTMDEDYDNDATADYPNSYENRPDVDDSTSKIFRSKHVINTNKNTIELVDTDESEMIKITHYSGSFKEWGNRATIELATGVDQKLVIGDQFLTVRGDKYTSTRGDEKHIHHGNVVEQYGMTDANFVKQILDYHKVLAEYKQLFTIKRVDNFHEPWEVSPLQEMVGSFIECPLCCGPYYDPSLTYRYSPVMSVDTICHPYCCYLHPIPFTYECPPPDEFTVEFSGMTISQQMAALEGQLKICAATKAEVEYLLKETREELDECQGGGGGGGGGGGSGGKCRKLIIKPEILWTVGNSSTENKSSVKVFKTSPSPKHIHDPVWEPIGSWFSNIKKSANLVELIPADFCKQKDTELEGIIDGVRKADVYDTYDMYEAEKLDMFDMVSDEVEYFRSKYHWVDIDVSGCHPVAWDYNRHSWDESKIQELNINDDNEAFVWFPSGFSLYHGDECQDLRHCQNDDPIYEWASNRYLTEDCGVVYGATAFDCQNIDHIDKTCVPDTWLDYTTHCPHNCALYDNIEKRHFPIKLEKNYFVDNQTAHVWICYRGDNIPASIRDKYDSGFDKRYAWVYATIILYDPDAQEDRGVDSAEPTVVDRALEYINGPTIEKSVKNDIYSERSSVRSPCSNIMENTEWMQGTRGCGTFGGVPCPCCNNEAWRKTPWGDLSKPSLSPSTFMGDWAIEDRLLPNGELDQKQIELAPLITEAELKLGHGGDKIENISMSKVETIGLVFNDLPSIRVDPIGKLRLDGMYVTPEACVPYYLPSPHVEYVDVADIPGGDYNLTICNKWRVNVGSKGISQQTTGPFDMYGKIFNIASEQMNICSKNEIVIDGNERLEFRARKITFYPTQENAVTIAGQLHCTRNAIIKGGMYIDGELALNHITAPIQWYKTAVGEWYPEPSCRISALLRCDFGAFWCELWVPHHLHEYMNIPLSLLEDSIKVRECIYSKGINNRADFKEGLATATPINSVCMSQRGECICL